MKVLLRSIGCLPPHCFTTTHLNIRETQNGEIVYVRKFLSILLQHTIILNVRQLGSRMLWHEVKNKNGLKLWCTSSNQTENEYSNKLCEFYKPICMRLKKQLKFPSMSNEWANRTPFYVICQNRFKPTQNNAIFCCRFYDENPTEQKAIRCCAHYIQRLALDTKSSLSINFLLQTALVNFDAHGNTVAYHFDCQFCYS